jgi:hypothetical protein
MLEAALAMRAHYDQIGGQGGTTVKDPIGCGPHLDIDIHRDTHAGGCRKPLSRRRSKSLEFNLVERSIG